MNPIRSYTSQSRQVLKQTLWRLASQNYHSAKAYRRFLFNRKSANLNSSLKNSLLIYQMGKVGSSTIVSSLKAQKLTIPVYHIHVLTQERISQLEEVLKKAYSSQHFIPPQLTVGEFLSKQIQRNLNGEKWKIVTLVRDPVARNISTFIQDIAVRHPDFGYLRKVQSMQIEELVEELIELYLEKHDHDFPLLWFDIELKQVFDVDVFSSKFPKSKGYKIYRGETAEVLLLRLESLKKCAAEAFKEFLTIEDFALKNDNIGSQKEYKTVYRKLLDTINLPDSYLDKMYTSQYTQHFYSEKEIKRFRTKWSKKC